MPEISEMGTSRYIKREELKVPTEFTCKEVVLENVAMESAPAEMKWVMRFNEVDKGLVLNKTNRENAAFVSGQSNSDNWAGQKFTLFNDMSVVYNNKRGGIRIQVAQMQATPNPAAGAAIQQATAPVTDTTDYSQEIPESDIPF